MKKKNKLIPIIIIISLVVITATLLIINILNNKTYDLYIYNDNNNITYSYTFNDRDNFIKNIKCKRSDCIVSNYLNNNYLLLKDDNIYLLNINNEVKEYLPNIDSIDNLKLTNNTNYIINTKEDNEQVYSIKKREYITNSSNYHYYDNELLYGVNINENNVYYNIIIDDEVKNIKEERDEIGIPSLELITINNKNIIITTDNLNLDKYYYAYDTSLNILFNNNRIKYIDNLSDGNLLICFDNSISILNDKLEEISTINKYNKILSMKLGYVIGVINDNICIEDINNNKSLYLTKYTSDLFIFDNDYKYDDSHLEINISSINSGEITNSFNLNRETFTLE